MPLVRPFKGIKPAKDLVHEIASLPYDVMNREEAKIFANGKPDSFLHVVRAEIDFDDEVSAYDEKVYLKARENLDKMIKDEKLIQDTKPNFYIYRQIMFGRVQTGIVASTSIDDYMNDTIKKHEFTRPQKEADRINNFDYCDANTAPIFLTYRKNDELNRVINDWIKFNKPMYDFKTEDDITHIIWTVEDVHIINKISEIFKNIEHLYIADGHHRTASAAKVGLKRREENPNYTGEEEFNYFMAVIFPDNDLRIFDYNRVVKDLNGNSVPEFLEKVKNAGFEIVEKGNEIYNPIGKHVFGMYLDDKWYEISAKSQIIPDHVIESLDVAILQNNLLGPILGIEDPRTDKRIDFVGGIRGLKELERRANTDMKVAFAVYPVEIADLLAVSDNDMVMPPKSTWFEPKLGSGLFIHNL